MGPRPRPGRFCWLLPAAAPSRTRAREAKRVFLVRRLEIGESFPPHPNRSGKFQGSTSNIQKSAKMQYSKVSRGCEFLVRRLEIGEFFPPHPNWSGKFQGSTSNIQKSA